MPNVKIKKLVYCIHVECSRCGKSGIIEYPANTPLKYIVESQWFCHCVGGVLAKFDSEQNPDLHACTSFPL